jgi:hypothetical protein
LTQGQFESSARLEIRQSVVRDPGAPAKTASDP